MSNPFSLEAHDVRKSFRDAESELVVIEGLSFVFPVTGSVAITGRSGIGKSTLMHLLGGLERPTSGKVICAGQDISVLDAEALAAFRSRTVGFVFQFHHLLPEFSALENVTLPLLIAGVKQSEADDRAEALLTRVGLKARLKHRPSQLSGGEQQRVSIARALINRPRVLLADEPTGNLDIKTAREIQDLLQEMNNDLDNLLIVVTHLGELARSMDCVLEMEPGGRLSVVPVA